MSTKFTREQIDQARQRADHAFSETAHRNRNRHHDGDIVAGATRRPGDEWIDAFTEALGLHVESEKPEPGVYFYAFVTGMEAVRIDSRATMVPLSDTDDFLHFGQYDPANLKPAKVVPAEPVELSEEEVGELWGDWIGDLAELNVGYHPEASTHLTATVNAALKLAHECRWSK